MQVTKIPVDEPAVSPTKPISRELNGKNKSRDALPMQQVTSGEFEKKPKVILNPILNSSKSLNLLFIPCTLSKLT